MAGLFTMTIDALINKWQKVNVRDVVEEAMYQTARDLVLYQRNQLLHGERSTGEKIGRYKNKAYALVKFQMNPFAGYGNIDLTLKEDYAKGIFVDVRENSVVFASADTKAEEIAQRFGEDVLGLNDKYAAEYSQMYLAPKFVEIVKRLL